MTPEYIRISAAAKWLGVSRATLYRRIADGALKKHRRFGVTHLKIDDLRKMIEGEG
jgi:excisionase family DNA binding protein